MADDLRIKKFKDSPLGVFLCNLKFLVKDYSIDLLCRSLVGNVGNPWIIKRQILGLTRKGYFDISEENNETFFKLTFKGMKLVELLKFITGKIKWDKRWRILIFDIPEKEKYKREALRKKMNELGMKQLQKSVWITPHPLPQDFTKFISNLRARPYLFSLTVEHINREKELKEYFGLKH